MATTFARLCQQVDQTQKELEAEIHQLTAKIDQLETIQSHSKSLRSVLHLLLTGAGGVLILELCSNLVGEIKVELIQSDCENRKKYMDLDMLKFHNCDWSDLQKNLVSFLSFFVETNQIGKLSVISTGSFPV